MDRGRCYGYVSDRWTIGVLKADQRGVIVPIAARPTLFDPMTVWPGLGSL